MKASHCLTIVLILSIFLANGQKRSGSNDGKTHIDEANVDYVQIRNQNKQEDFVEIIFHRLKPEQAKIFADKWNNAGSRGKCKFVSKYWIDVVLKDGTKRTFRINGRSIKENNDTCFDLGDLHYIEQVWAERNN